jgi:hypothetical protein
MLFLEVSIDNSVVFTFTLARQKDNTYVCSPELQSGLRFLMNDLGPFLKIARSFGNANIQFNIHMIIPFQMQLFFI